MTFESRTDVVLEGERMEVVLYLPIHCIGTLCAGGDPTPGCATEQGKAPVPLLCAKSVASRRKAVYLLCKLYPPLLVLVCEHDPFWPQKSWEKTLF